MTVDCWLNAIFAVMKILMVCLGNICRSPLAEGILQDKAFKAGFTWSVESAGTNSYHIGQPPHPLSQKIARINGIDISKQRARRFTADDFEIYDKIYALAEDVVDDIRYIAGKKFDPTKIDLLMNELYPGKNMDVPDPYYGSEADYYKAYKLIDEACEAIIEKYSIDKFKSIFNAIQVTRTWQNHPYHKAQEILDRMLFESAIIFLIQ